jgi:hypothetical protein
VYSGSVRRNFISSHITAEEKSARTIERQREELTRLRALNKMVMRGTGLTYEISVDKFKEFLAAEPPKPFKVDLKPFPAHKPLTKSVFDSDHSEIASLAISDLHLGEVVVPLEVNGLNKYSPMVCANRLYLLVDKFKRIVRGHQSMYGIDKIWLPFLGDMVSGSIHPELAMTNSILDIPAAVLVSRLMILVVINLKTLGLPIEIDAVVGNHARTTIKMPTKRQAHTSYDWLAYVMVQQFFADDPRVTVRVHQSQFGLVDQMGHRFVIEHTYGHPGKDMESLESKIRNIFDSALYRSATGMEGTAVDMVIGADKHRPTRANGYIVNGSVIGSSELTTSWRLSPIPAAQVCWGISKRNPATWCYFLELTDETSDKPKNVFSQYTDAFMRQHGR